MTGTHSVTIPVLSVIALIFLPTVLCLPVAVKPFAIVSMGIFTGQMLLLMPSQQCTNNKGTALLEWYFKIITTRLPPSCLNFTGIQSVSELIPKLLHSCTSHLLLVSPLICLWYYNLISLSGPSTQLTRICYLCHAATTAVLDKEVLPTD